MHSDDVGLRSDPASGNPVRLTLTEAYRHAVALHHSGELAQAGSLYVAILSASPDHLGALQALGMLEAQRGNLQQAERLLGRARELDPQSADACTGHAHVLRMQRRFEEALAGYDAALANRPDVVELHNERGVVLRELGRADEALASFERALTANPRLVEALYNRGLALQDLGRHADAVASYDSALALRPDLAEALNNRGRALADLQRYEEAIASWERALAIRPGFAEALNNRAAALKYVRRQDVQPACESDAAPALVSRGAAQHGLDHLEEALASYDDALRLRPDFAEALSNRGAALKDLRRYEEALASYDRALAIRPDFADAWSNRGAALLELTRYREALANCERALAIEPDFAEAWNNRGAICAALSLYPEAVASYDRAIALKPDFAEAFQNRGSALCCLGRYEEASRDLSRALESNRDLPFAKGMLVHARMHCCAWDSLEERSREIVDDVRLGRRAAEPFAFLGISDSPEDQLACAKVWVRERCPPATGRYHFGTTERGRKRIRLAYLSSDFHDHATAYLMAGLLERHDRRQFETIAVSFGPDAQDPMRARLREAFESFIDVRQQSDPEVASLLREMEVDIAVDLKGFTHGARTGILALRPAPVQVSFLGYPGTMGADYIDYVIADEVVIPLEEHATFAERVVYLPDTYQPNDSRRRIADHAPTRAEVGLPEEGFVFCSFNSSYKIAPAVFDLWMRLLERVEGSVLWLLQSNAAAPPNLRREAARRGIAPDRLVFAPKVPLADHLARHRLADLFLDTLPCNAHTTASDALWAGLPVLTCLGTTFAGRVAASLLLAVGLPEMIARTLDEYESMALRMATDAEALDGLRQRLARNRDTFPLFDTDRFRRHLEAAYLEMWERHRRGLSPASFRVGPNFPERSGACLRPSPRPIP